MCMRYYVKMSPDYINGMCNMGKFQEIEWNGGYGGAGPGIQTGTNDYSPANMFFSCRYAGGGVTKNCARSGSLMPADILGQWTRIELCVETSAGFGGGSGNVFIEGYWKRISDGKTQTINYQNIGTYSLGTSPDSETFKIANMFRGDDNLTCVPYNGLPPNAYRDISHAMVAEWPIQQQGLFIGAAPRSRPAAGRRPRPRRPRPRRLRRPRRCCCSDASRDELRGDAAGPRRLR